MKLSASKVSLLSKCRYPFREDVEWRDWPDTDDSRQGKALHRLSEWYIAGRPPDVVAAAREFECEEMVPHLAKVWLHMLRWLEDYKSEMCFGELKLALNLDRETARVLSEPGDRDYSDCAPGEIPMTLDVVRFAHGLVEVRDWKTGYSADGYWPQIATNALALAWYTRARLPKDWQRSGGKVAGGILHATESGVDASRVRTFDAYDLAAIADDLRVAYSEVAGSRPAPGDHCLELRCQALSTCPAKREQAKTLLSIDPHFDQRALSLRIDSVENGIKILEASKVVGALKKQIDEALKAFVGGQERTAEDGSVLYQGYRTMPRLSVPELMALARSLGATDAQIDACIHPNRESAGLRVRRPKVIKAAIGEDVLEVDKAG